MLFDVGLGLIKLKLKLSVILVAICYNLSYWKRNAINIHIYYSE